MKRRRGGSELCELIISERAGRTGNNRRQKTKDKEQPGSKVTGESGGIWFKLVQSVPLMTHPGFTHRVNHYEPGAPSVPSLLHS